ncbi:hypothetical protein GCM10022256_25090 [Frondihabitans peucedani]|uniref:ABM domain-containing protein n=2 Tax=Frondihabitans peucedani TaxID=598626 RepID=A0ABP8E425_9MICO
MSMTVLLEMTLRPDATEAQSIISETLAQTRAYSGNEGIEVLVDDDDSAKLVVVETWESTAHHAAYAEWRTTPEGQNRLGEIVAAPPVKRIFSETLDI